MMDLSPSWHLSEVDVGIGKRLGREGREGNEVLQIGQFDLFCFCLIWCSLLLFCPLWVVRVVYLSILGVVLRV